jgi:hypothetical protein
MYNRPNFTNECQILKNRTINNIIEKLQDTDECLITDDHIGCIRKILERELWEEIKDE